MEGDFTGSLAREDIRTLNETRGAGWVPARPAAPTAEEWTAKESITLLGWYIEFDAMNGVCIGNELTAKGIANAHNASIAAEREKHIVTEQLLIEANKELQQQLAAEKEKVAMNEGIEDELREANQKYYDCKVQLATEREDAYTEGYTKAVGEWLRGEPIHSDKSYHPDCPCKLCRNELHKQLAAAVEALSDLRDYQNGPPLLKYEKQWNEAMRKADAVLAKLGDGK